MFVGWEGSSMVCHIYELQEEIACGANIFQNLNTKVP